MTAPQLYPKPGDAVVVDHVKYRARGRIQKTGAEHYELELAKPPSRKPRWLFRGFVVWDKAVGIWRGKKPYTIGSISEA